MSKWILLFVSLAVLLAGVGLADEAGSNVVDLDVLDAELLDQDVITGWIIGIPRRWGMVR